MNDLLFRSVTDLCAAIRGKELSPVELMEAVLTNLDESQSSINAFITVTETAARSAAAAAEQAVMDGADLGPLHGVPFAVKDLTYTKGVRTTMGSYLHDTFIPTTLCLAIEINVPLSPNTLIRLLHHKGAVLQNVKLP